MAAGLSLRCGDCGAQLRSVEEAQAHAEATSHANFAESTEAVLNLICAGCGKPCRSQTEVDLHTKRTGHAEFTDKTMEAAKPIDLEAPLKPASVAMDVDTSGSGEPQDAEMVAPEVNKEMLADLESMGFSTGRATRALHFSGWAGAWQGRGRRHKGEDGVDLDMLDEEDVQPHLDTEGDVGSPTRSLGLTRSSAPP